MHDWDRQINNVVNVVSFFPHYIHVILMPIKNDLHPRLITTGGALKDNFN